MNKFLSKKSDSVNEINTRVVGMDKKRAEQAEIRKKKDDQRKKFEKGTASDEYSQIPKPEPSFSTAKTILETDFRPLEWVIEDILPEGLGLFVGKPKIGKSVFTLNVAIAISTDSMAFETLSVSHGRVLYCALEDSARRLKDRLLKMLPYGHKMESLQNLDFSTDFPNMDCGGCDRLKEYIGKHSDTKLIIIDTWGKFKPSYRNDKASYDSDYNAISRLKSIADENHIAIMLIHHTRKMEAADAFDTVSGTLGLTGSADTIAILNNLNYKFNHPKVSKCQIYAKKQKPMILRKST